MTLATPASPVVPVVLISAPGSVGSCDDILIDVSGSSGDCGRRWNRVTWDVKGYNRVNITRFLNTNFTDTNTVVKIPNSMLKPGAYSFSLFLQNAFDQIAVSTKELEVTKSAATPRVTIQSDVDMSPLKYPHMYRWQSLYLLASVSVPACAGEVGELTYVWKVYKDAQFQGSIQVYFE